MKLIKVFMLGILLLLVQKQVLADPYLTISGGFTPDVVKNVTIGTFTIQNDTTVNLPLFPTIPGGFTTTTTSTSCGNPLAASTSCTISLRYDGSAAIGDAVTAELKACANPNLGSTCVEKSFTVKVVQQPRPLATLEVKATYLASGDNIGKVDYMITNETAAQAIGLKSDISEGKGNIDEDSSTCGETLDGKKTCNVIVAPTEFDSTNKRLCLSASADNVTTPGEDCIAQPTISATADGNATNHLILVAGANPKDSTLTVKPEDDASPLFNVELPIASLADTYTVTVGGTATRTCAGPVTTDAPCVFTIKPGTDSAALTTPVNITADNAAVQTMPTTQVEFMASHDHIAATTLTLTYDGGADLSPKDYGTLTGADAALFTVCNLTGDNCDNAQMALKSTCESTTLAASPGVSSCTYIIEAGQVHRALKTSSTDLTNIKTATFTFDKPDTGTATGKDIATVTSTPQLWAVGQFHASNSNDVSNIGYITIPGGQVYMSKGVPSNAGCPSGLVGDFWDSANVRAPLNAVALFGDDIVIGGGFNRFARAITDGSPRCAPKLNHLARYDGTALVGTSSPWSALDAPGGLNGIGVSGTAGNTVNAFAEPTTGPCANGLLVGGAFLGAAEYGEAITGSNHFMNIACYDGNGNSGAGAWTPMGSDNSAEADMNGVDTAVNALYSSGENNTYLGGAFEKVCKEGECTTTTANRIAKLSDTTGTIAQVGAGVNEAVNAITECNSRLFVGGAFTTATGIANTKYFAKTNTDKDAFVTTTDTNLGNLVDGLAVNALACVNNKVMLGGVFDGGGDLARIAQYDTTSTATAPSLTAIGTGFDDDVNALLSTDDVVGSSNIFLAAGAFASGNTVTELNRIAQIALTSATAGEYKAYGGTEFGDGFVNALLKINAATIALK